MYKAFLGLLLLAASAFPASAQTLGQQYHTREPHTCASKASPKSGALSNAQAAQYLTCIMEVEGSRQLVLVSDVQVQVGSGTRYNDMPAIRRPGSAAPNAMIYAIRGSYKRYTCEVPSSYTLEGQHCNVVNHAHAEGLCYLDSFNEWYCAMADNNAPYGTPNQPPPAK